MSVVHIDFFLRVNLFVVVVLYRTSVCCCCFCGQQPPTQIRELQNYTII